MNTRKHKERIKNRAQRLLKLLVINDPEVKAVLDRCRLNFCVELAMIVHRLDTLLDNQARMEDLAPSSKPLPRKPGRPKINKR